MMTDPNTNPRVDDASQNEVRPPISRRRALTKLALSGIGVLALKGGIGLATAKVASDASEEVVIDEPGVYELSSNIKSLSVTVGGVEIKGNSNTIAEPVSIVGLTYVVFEDVVFDSANPYPFHAKNCTDIEIRSCVAPRETTPNYYYELCDGFIHTQSYGEVEVFGSINANITDSTLGKTPYGQPFKGDGLGNVDVYNNRYVGHPRKSAQVVMSINDAFDCFFTGNRIINAETAFEITNSSEVVIQNNHVCHVDTIAVDDGEEDIYYSNNCCGKRCEGEA